MMDNHFLSLLQPSEDMETSIFLWSLILANTALKEKNQINSQLLKFKLIRVKSPKTSGHLLGLKSKSQLRSLEEKYFFLWLKKMMIKMFN